MSSPFDPAAEAVRLACRAIGTYADNEWRPQVRKHLEDLVGVLEGRPTTHVIDFTAHGWTIMHPLVGCGRNLFSCPVNEAAERGVTRPPRPGRYVCEAGNGGLLMILGEVAVV